MNEQRKSRVVSLAGMRVQKISVGLLAWAVQCVFTLQLICEAEAVMQPYQLIWECDPLENHPALRDQTLGMYGRLQELMLQRPVMTSD